MGVGWVLAWASCGSSDQSDQLSNRSKWSPWSRDHGDCTVCFRLNAAVLSTLHSRSHYNSLLLLQKEGFFAPSWRALVDEKLQTMSDTIKTFQGYCLPEEDNTDDSDE